MKRVFLVFTTFVFLISVLGLALASTPVDARTKVRGYYKPKTGTYVQPHYRSSPNRTKLDNWSTRWNINPYTGKKGTVNPFKITPKKR